MVENPTLHFQILLVNEKINLYVFFIVFFIEWIKGMNITNEVAHGNKMYLITRHMESIDVYKL